MSGTIVNAVPESRGTAGFSRTSVVGLLDTVETAMVVGERNGQIVLMNARARKLLSMENGRQPESGLFTDVLQTEAKQIFREIESGKQEVHLDLTRGEERFIA